MKVLGSLLICILCTAHGLQNYDVSLSGQVKLSPDFLAKIRTGNKAKGGPDVVQFDIKVPPEILQIMGIDDKKDIFRASSLEKQPSSVISSDFIKQLTAKGVTRIRSAAEILKKHLKLQPKQQKMLESRMDVAITEYLTRLQERIDYLLKQKMTSTVDKEIILLDVITSSNDIYFNESKLLLNEIINKNISENDIKVGETAIFVEYQTKKNEDYKYLCENFNLCRHFPVFTDFSLELLNELLKTPNDLLNSFGENLVKIINLKLTAAEYDLGDHLISIMKSKIKTLFTGDASNIRKNMENIKTFLIQRRKWQISKSKKWNRKRKAMLIFLDVVDKVFETDEIHIIAKHFETMISGVRSWAERNRNDIETIIYTMANYILETLSRSVNDKKGMKEELKTLAEVIFKGTAKRHKHLLSDGSAFTSKS